MMRVVKRTVELAAVVRGLIVVTGGYWAGWLVGNALGMLQAFQQKRSLTCTLSDQRHVKGEQ